MKCISIVYEEDPIGGCSGKSLQNENTRVRSTQNRIAQLSEVEDDGENIDQKLPLRNFDARNEKIGT